MTKDKIILAIICLFIGGIIGFVLANNLNRNAPPAVASNPVDTGLPDPKLPPDHPAVGTNGGQTDGGALPQIAEAIEKARQNPTDFEAQMTAADLYYQIRRFEDAAKFYEQAGRLKPNEAEPIIKLGNSYFDAEKFELAEQWYQAALQQNPKDLNVRTDYALTFYLRSPRDLDRAIKEYLITLGMDPNHELTLQNLVVAYREKEDLENASKTLEVLKKVNPENPAVREKARDR